MKAEEITKGSTLLATLNEENYPFGMHKDLIDDLHRMINIALSTPVVVGQSEQLCDCGKPVESAYDPCCSLTCWCEMFDGA